MEPTEKLRLDIKHFLEVYHFLSAEGKAQFEAQMAGELKKVDPKTKELYYSLLQAAKEGRSIDEAIDRLNQTTR